MLKARCSDCGLFRTCKTPYMPYTGEGQRGVLIVAEAPGQQEDERGIQLIGEAGQLLRRRLRDIGVDLDRDCWKTNSLICRPPANRTPTAKEIDFCRPNLLDTINATNPKVIIAMGFPAVKSLVGQQHADVGQIMRWVGHQIPDQKYNAWICPTWHPSYLLRQGENPAGKSSDVTALWFARHLKAAFAIADKPYETAPDYLGEVQRLEPDAAAKVLDSIPRDRGIMAFDYETNMIKPDRANARIYSASVAWGEGPEPTRVVAYRWVGAAVAAHQRLMAAPVLKVAHNVQMEDRWTRKFCGHPPRNWRWCTQQGAHVADNRENTTSLDFQGYVHLGQADYDADVSPYLKANGTTLVSKSNATNRIREVPIPRLLLYCGADSGLCYRLAWRQAAMFGVPLLKDV